jgi:hypothetical protein
VNLGPLRPYGAVGLSLIGANLASQPGLAALEDTAAGYNAGGGLFIWLGKPIGLRGPSPRLVTVAPDETTVFSRDHPSRPSPPVP